LQAFCDISLLSGFFRHISDRGEALPALWSPHAAHAPLRRAET
jgi:hypothetical protein